MEPIAVTHAEYVQNFCIALMFNNGTKGMVDLSQYLDGEIFEPLKDLNYFRNFKVDTWTIGWDNGADFAPEFLYELVIQDEIKKLS